MWIGFDCDCDYEHEHEHEHEHEKEEENASHIFPGRLDRLGRLSGSLNQKSHLAHLVRDVLRPGFFSEFCLGREAWDT